MVLMCLDVGSRRIGVAASDELGIAAHPVTVIERTGLNNDLATIVELCRERGAEKVIVGLPLDQEGEEGPAAKKVLRFVGYLTQALDDAHLNIPVETWDERYSTAAAEDFLIEADVSRTKRRRVIDKMAAAVILKRYMDSKSGD